MKKALGVALLLAFSTVVPVSGRTAEPLGRLFFTPAERKSLDAGVIAATKKVPDKPAPRTVRLDGVVTRSDSDRTVWVNGTAYHGGAPEGVQVRTNRAAPATTTIEVPGKGTSTRVKVGQRLDLNTGRIREDLSRQANTEDPSASAETPAGDTVTEKPGTTSVPAPAKRETDSGPAAAAR